MVYLKRVTIPEAEGEESRTEYVRVLENGCIRWVKYLHKATCFPQLELALCVGKLMPRKKSSDGYVVEHSVYAEKQI